MLSSLLADFLPQAWLSVLSISLNNESYLIKRETLRAARMGGPREREYLNCEGGHKGGDEA